MKFFPAKDQWIPVMIIVLVTMVLTRMVFSKVPFLGPILVGPALAPADKTAVA